MKGFNSNYTTGIRFYELCKDKHWTEYVLSNTSIQWFLATCCQHSLYGVWDKNLTITS